MKLGQIKHKVDIVSINLIILSFILTPFVYFSFYWLDQIVLYNTGFILFEFMFALFFMGLIYWYMNSTKFKSRLGILSLIIGTSTAFLFMYGILTYLFLSNASEFTAKGKEKEQEFSKQQAKYIPLVTTIFDRAEKTNVRKYIDKEYKAHLANGLGRKPVYFIRLKNDKLQKLFQSGQIKYEDIDTIGEKVVRDMLLGKTNPIQFPQHTCCGGDDLSWNEEPFFRIFVPERRYLKDFYSELETILLIKDKNSKILGALVELYAD